jgi:nitrogen fixation protein FixH
VDAERRVEPWPIAVVALLVAMMAVSVGFWRVAAANPDPLVVGDAYEAGLALNDELRERRAAEALGVEVRLVAELEPGAARVRVTLRRHEGAPARATRVVVRRERPAEGGLDADFELAPEASGFAGRVPLPRPGRWHLVVTATVEGRPVRETFAVQAG